MFQLTNIIHNNTSFKTPIEANGKMTEEKK